MESNPSLKTPSRSTSSFKISWHWQCWQLILRINGAARQRKEESGEKKREIKSVREGEDCGGDSELHSLQPQGFRVKELMIKWVFEYGVSLFKPNSSRSCPRNTNLTCCRREGKKKNQGQSHQLLSKRRKRAGPRHRSEQRSELLSCKFFSFLLFCVLHLQLC